MSTFSSAVASASRRLLVVDDDPFYREIASSSLQAEGYQVKTASDGIEALTVFSSKPLDIAVVDLTMPRMDGLKLIARVRESSHNQHLPIIIITGSDDTETIERAFAVGATSFVAKPINWPLFAQHVNYVYRAAQAEAELRHNMRTSEFLSELKDKLLSVLVSEFQSPLRIAHSMTQLLRKEAFGPLGHQSYLECAEDLHKALQRLTATQLKMMNAGRVLSQGLLLREEDVLLGEVVTEAVESLRDKAERRSIKIEHKNGIPESLQLKCDRSLISQAFRLILDGAIQFAPPKSWITIDSKIDPAVGFTFSVADEGPPLPDEVIGQILNVPTGTWSDPQTTSIARNASLTITRVLAEAHQGRLALASTIGEGNIARFTLPRERISMQAVSPGTTAGALGNQTGGASQAA